MTANGINWWDVMPPESPDINVIEKVWHQLKQWLRNVHKPQNKEELIQGIGKFWSEKMTVDQCQRYIGHINKVLPEIIGVEGKMNYK